MPIPANVTAALARLASFYNGRAYGGTNLGGLANDGHRKNFIPILQDVALAVQGGADYISSVITGVSDGGAVFDSSSATTPPGDLKVGATYWATSANGLSLLLFRYDGSNKPAPVLDAGGSQISLATAASVDSRISSAIQMALSEANLLSAMPKGAVGLWLPSNATQVDRAFVIPNIVAPRPPSYAQLFRGTRGIFSADNIWSHQNSTVVDNNAAGPDGIMDASTITITAGSPWVLYQGFPGDPSGDYRIGLYVRRASGSPKLKFGEPFTNTWSLEITLTDTWQWVSAVYPKGPYNIFGIGNDNPTGGGTIEIRDLCLYHGTADLGPWPLGGHIQMPVTSIQNAVIGVANGVMRVPTNQGLIQWPSPLPFGPRKPSSLVYIFRRDGDGDTRGGTAVISGFEDDSFLIGSEILNAIGYGFGPLGLGTNQPVGEPQGVPWLFDDTGTALLVFAHVWDGVVCKSYINGVEVLSYDNTPILNSLSSGEHRTWYFGVIAHQDHRANASFGPTAYYQRALSADEVRQSTVALTNSLAAAGSVVGIVKWCFFIGDQGLHSDAPGAAAAQVVNRVHGGRYTTDGAHVGDAAFTASINRVLARKAEAPSGQAFVCVIYVGSNDLGTNNAPAVLTALAAKCDALRSAGIRVVVCKLFDFYFPANQAQFDVDRANFNSAVAGWVGTHADAVCDLASVPGMGANGSFSNATNFRAPGNRGPTKAGDALLAPVIAATLDRV